MVHTVHRSCSYFVPGIRLSQKYVHPAQPMIESRHRQSDRIVAGMMETMRRPAHTGKCSLSRQYSQSHCTTRQRAPSFTTPPTISSLEPYRWCHGAECAKVSMAVATARLQHPFVISRKTLYAACSLPRGSLPLEPPQQNTPSTSQNMGKQ